MSLRAEPPGSPSDRLDARTARARPATPADLPAVAAIFAHYVATSAITFAETAPDPAQWRRRLDDLAAAGLPFLVAEVGGRVEGYAYAGPWRVHPAYRYTVEDSIYIAPGSRGRGLGGLLLRELIGRCARAGLHRMVAVISDLGEDEGGGSSVTLHRRCGFTEVGTLTEVGHKQGRFLGTVLMERDLSLPA